MGEKALNMFQYKEQSVIKSFWEYTIYGNGLMWQIFNEFVSLKIYISLSIKSKFLWVWLFFSSTKALGNGKRHAYSKQNIRVWLHFEIKTWSWRWKKRESFLDQLLYCDAQEERDWMITLLSWIGCGKEIEVIGCQMAGIMRQNYLISFG